jgi:hypothetical protein
MVPDAPVPGSDHNGVLAVLEQGRVSLYHPHPFCSEFPGRYFTPVQRANPGVRYTA